jgi:uncharacterized protein with HEPN domain
MNTNDLTRFTHMLEAAKEAQDFIHNRDKEDLDTNRMLVLSLLKLIEIIGEAAANISKETQNQIPQLPWPAIIAMRNRLVHGYFAVDLDRVWDTVTNDLPPLITELENIIASAQL